MAKHKAAHDLTIAPTQEQTPFHLFVERHWPKAAGLAALLSALFLVRVYQGEQVKVEADASWDRLREDVEFSPSGGFIRPPEAAKLAGLADELKTDQAGAWAKALEVSRHIEDGDYEAARRSLGELTNQWPNHVLVTRPFPFGADRPAQTLAEHLETSFATMSAWKSQHASIFETTGPSLPAGAEDAGGDDGATDSEG